METLTEQVQRHERRLAACDEGLSRLLDEIDRLGADLEQTKFGTRWTTQTLDAMRVRLERLERR